MRWRLEEGRDERDRWMPGILVLLVAIPEGRNDLRPCNPELVPPPERVQGARGFITSATVLCVKRPASWEPPLRKPRQRARVRSRAERMPCGVAPSPWVR